VQEFCLLEDRKTKEASSCEEADSPSPLPVTSPSPIEAKGDTEDKVTQTTVGDILGGQSESKIEGELGDSIGSQVEMPSSISLLSTATSVESITRKQHRKLPLLSNFMHMVIDEDDASFTATDYLERDTDDESKQVDSRRRDARCKRNRRHTEVVQGLKITIKEIKKWEAAIEARELQVQFDQDKVRNERESQRQKEGSAITKQYTNYRMALALDIATG
jgi:hypothetical protein